MTRDPAQDAVAAPRLSEEEREALTAALREAVGHDEGLKGCTCCPALIDLELAPAVERILAARLAPIEALAEGIEKAHRGRQAGACSYEHRTLTGWPCDEARHAQRIRAALRADHATPDTDGGEER